MTVASELSPPAAPSTPAGRWLGEGARIALFRSPDWRGLTPSPWSVAGFLAADYLLAFAIERAVLPGHPTPLWTGILGGWLATALNTWLCWVVARQSRLEGGPMSDAASLFMLLCGFGIVGGLVEGTIFITIARFVPSYRDWSAHAYWIYWLAPMAWVWAARSRLFMRATPHRPTRALIFVTAALASVAGGWLNPVYFWRAEPPPEEPGPPQLSLTQDVLEGQPRLLAAALDGLRAQRPGKVDVYAITYAPYASQDVFMRESATVADTMARRFDAAGRIVQLVDNPATARTLPWATPLNLQRTIQRMAATMNRDEDVLFLHLTSHGGADGELATEFWPLELDPVTPVLLKKWLDDAGVRWRVISISACYSGSWIAPLSGDGTLVMTAADASHTSYGCGSRSPLTFFGQAMYVDALKSTWSFEQAHARARQLIAQREKEAGKQDGYSNPQISVGTGARARLLLLQDQLARAARPGAAGASAATGG